MGTSTESPDSPRVARQHQVSHNTLDHLAKFPLHYFLDSFIFCAILPSPCNLKAASCDPKRELKPNGEWPFGRASVLPFCRVEWFHSTTKQMSDGKPFESDVIAVDLSEERWETMPSVRRTERSDQAPLPDMDGLSAKQVMALYLLASGKGFGETAKVIGVKPAEVGAWYKNKSFQELLKKEIAVTGRGLIEAKLELSVGDSLDTLIFIRDHGRKDSDRISAAKELLDRALGKAPQTIYNNHSNGVMAPNDEEQRRQLEERVKQKLKQQGMVPNQ